MNAGNAAVDNPAPLRKVEDLTPEEVRNARLAIAELIFERVPNLEAALTRKRKELAVNLGCSEGTLNSVTAYVRYWATQAIQEAQATALSRDDVVSTWYYLEQSAVSGQTDAWNGLEDVFLHIGGLEKGATLEQLQSAVEAYRRRLKTHIVRKAKAEGMQSGTTQVVGSPTISSPSDTVHETGRVAEADITPVIAAPVIEVRPPVVTGATFNYDNPEKTAWRNDVVMQYACESIPESERPHTKIVCFGGRKNLEPLAYIHHKFTPGNITSVECDEDVIPEFLASATEAGIQTYTGKLSDMRSKQRFGLASLDYTGPVTVERMLDAASMLLEDDATVIVNCQNKRDPKLMRVAALLQMGIMDQARGIDIGLEEFLPSGHGFNEHLKQAFGEAPDTQLNPEEWAKGRRKFIVLTLSSFGIGRRESVSLHGFPNLERLFLMSGDRTQRVGETPPEDKMGELLGRFGDEYCAAYGRFTGVPAHALMRNTTLSMVMGTRMAFTSRPIISNLRFEKYYSEHDGTRNPFITACAHLRVPRDLYKKHHAVFHGMAQILEEMVKDENRQGRLRMEFATVKGRGLAAAMTKQIVQLAFKTPEGSVGNIDVKEIQQAFDELRALQQEHVCYALDEDRKDVDANAFSASDSIDATMARHAEKVKNKAMRKMNKLRQPRYKRY
jgi:hypothetical protein